MEFCCFPASSVDTDLVPGNYFAVPLETYSMETVFCPADPQKCLEKHSSMLECSLSSVSSGEIWLRGQKTSRGTQEIKEGHFSVMYVFKPHF